MTAPYVTRDASCAAPYGNAEYIPFFYHEPLTGEMAAQIFDQFRTHWQGKAAAPDNAVLFADFAESYDTLNALDRLLLKHPEADAGTAG